MIGIITDSTGDIAVDTSLDSDGLIMGLAIGDNTADVIERCLITVPGELKDSPMSGCNARAMLGGPYSKFAPAAIMQQLKAHGVRVNSIRIVNQDIQVDYDS
ncbi:MAG TPA: hypothetical protein PLP11_07410 [Bacteroidales bacterium]|nr:hypothetical protein [Bacteroidales bacterium]